MDDTLQKCRAHNTQSRTPPPLRYSRWGQRAVPPKTCDRSRRLLTASSALREGLLPSRRRCFRQRCVLAAPSSSLFASPFQLPVACFGLRRSGHGRVRVTSRAFSRNMTVPIYSADLRVLDSRLTATLHRSLFHGKEKHLFSLLQGNERQVDR